MPPTDKRDTNGRQFWDAYKIINLVLTLTVPITLWLVKSVQDNNIRLTRLESTVITSADYNELEKRIGKDLEQVRSLIPREVPPRWFAERVEGIRQQVVDLQKRVDKLEDR